MSPGSSSDGAEAPRDLSGQGRKYRSQQQCGSHSIRLYIDPQLWRIARGPQVDVRPRPVFERDATKLTLEVSDPIQADGWYPGGGK
jgi:hypothetical protein